TTTSASVTTTSATSGGQRHERLGLAAGGTGPVVRAERGSGAGGRPGASEVLPGHGVDRPGCYPDDGRPTISGVAMSLMDTIKTEFEKARADGAAIFEYVTHRAEAALQQEVAVLKA